MEKSKSYGDGSSLVKVLGHVRVVARAQNLAVCCKFAESWVAWAKWNHQRMYDPPALSMENYTREPCFHGGCSCLKGLQTIGLPQKHTYRAKVIMEKM